MQRQFFDICHRGQYQFCTKISYGVFFLDFTSAFDNVIPKILTERSREMGLPFKFNNRFIQNLIQDKNVQFIINGKIAPTHKSYKEYPNDQY